MEATLKPIKAEISITVGKATKLGLDYNPLKSSFFALVKNIKHDGDCHYEGIIKYQNKNIKVHCHDDDTEYWFMDKVIN